MKPAHQQSARQAATVVCLIIVFSLWSGQAAAQTSSTVVTVRTDASGRPINPFLYGINTARWDESLFPERTGDMLLTCDRDAIEKIRASGITMLKYPGGNDADAYLWNDPANNPSEMDTDEYIALCRAVGVEPFITVNFNAPIEVAAAWVRYCNRERGYGVRYWEVGDEQWGEWAKGHASPEEYAAKYVAFVHAMKAVDPAITIATNVPLGAHAEQWTARVLRSAGDWIDLLTFTFYPQQWGTEHNDSLLASPAVYRTQVNALRAEVERVLGPDRARKIWMVNVGYNSVNHSPGPQTVDIVNALWTADMLCTMAYTGTDVACYWAVHNAFPPRKGDYGFLSSEGSNTPHPSYYVFPMLSRRFLGHTVDVSVPAGDIRAYASRNAKTLTAVLLNIDKEHARDVDLVVDGMAPGPHAHWWVLDRERSAVECPPLQVHNGRVSFRIPPYALVVTEIIAADSVSPPANLAARAVASASSFSTIGPAFTPAQAIDGKKHTRWCSAAWTKSNGEEQQWIQLTWPDTVTISRVRLHWGETWARRYRVEMSHDGVAWTTIFSMQDGKGGMEDLTVSPIRTRYLRIAGDRGTRGISAYTLCECEVF